MEAWSNRKDLFENGSGVNSLVYRNGIDGYNCRLKSLFDQVFAVFLKEVPENECIRFLPVLTGSGKPLDLFKLYWIVRKIGGHDLVSSKNLWGSVAEHCGLNVGATACVKLAYFKYLAEFDHWLRQLCKDDGNMVKGDSGVIRRLESLSKELETRFTRVLPQRGEKRKDTNLFPSENGCEGEDICSDDGGIDLKFSTAENVIKTKIYAEHKSIDAENKNHYLNGGEIDNDEKCVSQDDYNCMISDGEVNERDIAKTNDNAGKDNDGKGKISANSVMKDGLDSRKRKRESSCFSGMLNWVIHAAKQSNNPKIGKVPDSSKWKCHTNDEFWVQVLLVREALLKKRHIDTNAEESNSQKKQRMHPSMYEEDRLNHQTAEKLRYSKRIPTSPKSFSCPCCKSSSTSHNKVTTHQKADGDNGPSLVGVEVSVPEKTDDSEDQETLKQVSVGPLYQAEVPEWTGVATESESKWLGTRMWPPEVETKKALVELDPVGTGRQGSCGCPFPHSVECIRFHIAEKRFKLKLELGTLFNRWRFNRMGEEVSLSWSDEEQERFKGMVMSSASSHNRFWKDSLKLFPSKTKEMLVSYYFNVYLIRRRSYQNRATPKDIDSDDDEIEFGSVGGNFGNVAVHVPGSRLLITCIQNEACTDLD